VEVVGNAKADLEIVAKSAFESPSFGLLVAGSTHAPEEKGLLLCFSRLRARHPHLRMVLAPRDCRRSPALRRQAHGAGFRASLWSAGDWRTDGWDVLVIDAIGQILPFYAAADLVVVGGSLANQGGHNILEPAALGRAILVGPHMDHFQELTERFLARDALVQVEGMEALEPALARMLDDPERRRGLGARARECAERERGASERYAGAVLELVDRSE
jgi:3-deoxy-D-manno-octulosonic-acid transferase